MPDAIIWETRPPPPGGVQASPEPRNLFPGGPTLHARDGSLLQYRSQLWRMTLWTLLIVLVERPRCNSAV